MYIYIITKQEFTSLLRFDCLPFNKERYLKENEKDFEAELTARFKKLAYFEYDEDYLFIKIESRPKESLRIKDMLEVIPFTKAAKYSLETKFSSELIFSEPCYENIIHKIEDKRDIEDLRNGGKAICKLMNISSESPYLSNLITRKNITSFYLHRINGIRSYEFRSDIFVHLLNYERYEMFPKDDIGYLYDLGEIYAHSNEMPSSKETKYYKYLVSTESKFNELKTFDELIREFEKNENTKNIIDGLPPKEMKTHLVILFYLKIKDLFASINSLTSDGQEFKRFYREFENKKECKKEINTAIYLNGLFFGYDKFFNDYLILSEEVKIYKTYKKKEKQTLVDPPIQEWKKDEVVETDKISSPIELDLNNDQVTDEVTEEVVNHTNKDTKEPTNDLKKALPTKKNNDLKSVIDIISNKNSKIDSKENVLEYEKIKKLLGHKTKKGLADFLKKDPLYTQKIEVEKRGKHHYIFTLKKDDRSNSSKKPGLTPRQQQEEAEMDGMNPD